MRHDVFLCCIMIDPTWTGTNAGGLTQTKKQGQWRMSDQRRAAKKGTLAVRERMRRLRQALPYNSLVTSTSRAAASWIQHLLSPSALVLMLGQHHRGLSHWLPQRKTCQKCLKGKNIHLVLECMKTHYTSQIRGTLQVRLVSLSGIQ